MRFRLWSSSKGSVGIRGKRGDWRMAPGVIVRPDAVDSYNGNSAVGAMVFVDPESTEGAWLKISLREDITMVRHATLVSLGPASSRSDAVRV
jgi:hypothetical protein